MGFGEVSGDLTKIWSSKDLCQHSQNYVDKMASMKVSHRVYSYVICIIIMLKIWAIVALVGIT